MQISHIFFFLHCIGKDEVTSSNLVISSMEKALKRKRFRAFLAFALGGERTFGHNKKYGSL